MKRNYVKELYARGYSRADIARETGISERKVSQISSGKLKIKSDSAEYAAIRNTNRRLAYREAVKAGANSKKATELRRTYVDPSAKTRTRPTERFVKHVESQNLWQFHLEAEFQNRKTKEIRYGEGFSEAHEKKNYSRDFGQAKRYAIAQFDSGSNWEIKKLITAHYVQYILA